MIRTLRIYCLNNFHIYHRAVLTVVFVLYNYLSYNWKFVPLDYLCPSSPPPPTSLVTTNLISSIFLFYFFFFFFLIKAILVGCISLMTNDIEHIFTRLLITWVSSLEKSLFNSFAHFWMGLFVFLLLSCEFFIYSEY